MKLSIIVPVYNVEKYLAACLDSLMYEGPEDYEIIVVNDGSTDGSGGIAASYAAARPELIRVMTKENGGLGSARNAAIEVAKGEYLLFVDSDDRLAEGALKEIFALLERGMDICIFGILSVSESGGVLDDIPKSPVEGEVKLTSFPGLLLLPPSACNKICRRSLFTDSGIRFQDRAWYEDLRTMPKFYLLTDKIYVTNRQWYIYLQRSGSIIKDARLRRNLEIIDAVDEISGWYRERGQYESYKNEFEYIAYYNQFLVASVRICVADSGSELADTLREDFLTKHPGYRENPYIRAMPLKHRLLGYLLMHGMKRTAAAVMRMNARLKHK